MTEDLKVSQRSTSGSLLKKPFSLLRDASPAEHAITATIAISFARRESFHLTLSIRQERLTLTTAKGVEPVQSLAREMSWR